MTELIFKVSHAKDLALLLQLAKRLGIPFAQRESKVQAAQTTSDISEPQSENKNEIMRKASNDPLFWADVHEVQHDFGAVDAENL